MSESRYAPGKSAAHILECAFLNTYKCRFRNTLVFEKIWKLEFNTIVEKQA